LHGSEKGGGPFDITGGNTSPALEVEHGVFYQVAKFIEVLVVSALDQSVLFGWDHRIHPLSCRLFEDGIGVIAPVGQKMVCGYSFDEGASLCAICGGTCRNKNSDRQTMCIHGQMYLGVEPPFVRLMA
jgi:hypothetical protein